MDHNILISRASLEKQAAERIRKNEVVFGRDDLCHVADCRLGSNYRSADSAAKFTAISGALRMNADQLPDFNALKQYGSAFDIPRPCATLGKTMSVREMQNKGLFSPKGSTNTLMSDWQQLWDALRVDLSIRKAATGTIRQFIYKEHNLPGATRKVGFQEFFPYNIIFEKHNGSGQAVRQGETRGGQNEEITLEVYAAGFTWDLLAELFDMSFDMNRINDAVTVAYNALRDDLAISPIINGSYGAAGTAKHTAANTTSGAARQELLYLTIEDALDDLGEREDPITGRLIDPTDSVILAAPGDARHIARVLKGLPSQNEKSYPGITDISQVLSYGGETIVGRNEVTEYAGCTPGTAFLIKSSRYANIAIKRNLTLEIDMKPDVKTLSREERAWYFVEGVQYSDFLTYFVQQITLPSWS